MTYQISYCIYTAATVEAQMLRTAANELDRTEAAARLAHAVKVLQDEAKHTPGSGRSLDTIRRLLNAGGSQLSVAAESFPNAPVPARQTQRTARAEHDASEASRGTERESSSTIQDIGREPPSLTLEGASAFVGADPTSYFVPNDLNWSDPFNLSVLDTGAGFHPDACSWGLADNYPRTPNLGSHSEYVNAPLNGGQQWDDPFNRSMAWG